MTTAPVPAPCPTETAAGPGQPSGQPGGRSGLLTYLPGAAGVAYLVAWIAGLAAWPSNLPLNATAAQTAAAYAAHPGPAATQYLLVEGLAGLLLGVVLGCTLLPRLRGGAAFPGGGPAPLRSAAPAPLRAAGAALLAAVAVGTSLVQCVLGLVLTGAATGHQVSRSGELSTGVNHLDGVKMLTLAGVAVLLAVSGGPVPALPRWLRVVAGLLAAALVASACAYLAQAQPLAWTAYVSGSLLLVWVTGLGSALTIRRRAARGSGDGPGTGR